MENKKGEKLGNCKKIIIAIIIIFGIILVGVGIYYLIKHEDNNSSKNNDPNLNPDNGYNEPEISDEKIVLNDSNWIVSFDSVKTNYENAVKELNESPENNCVINNGLIEIFSNDEERLTINDNDIVGTPIKCQEVSTGDEIGFSFYILTQEGSVYEISAEETDDSEFEVTNIKKNIKIKDKISNFVKYKHGQYDNVAWDSLLFKLENGKIVDEKGEEISETFEYYTFENVSIMNDGCIEHDANVYCSYNDSMIKVKELLVTQHYLFYIIDQNNYLYKIDDNNNLMRMSDKKVKNTSGYEFNSNEMFAEILNDDYAITITFES